MALAPMGRDGVQPLGSMGTDTSLAVLSDKPRLLKPVHLRLPVWLHGGRRMATLAIRAVEVMACCETAPLLPPDTAGRRLALTGMRRHCRRSYGPATRTEGGRTLVDGREDNRL